MKKISNTAKACFSTSVHSLVAFVFHPSSQKWVRQKKSKKYLALGEPG